MGAWFAFLVLLGVGMLGLRVCNDTIGPVVSPSSLRRVTPGMTKTQVLRALGKPQTIVSTKEWEYSRSESTGWGDVYFDDNGRVTSVNDGSSFP